MIDRWIGTTNEIVTRMMVSKKVPSNGDMSGLMATSFYDIYPEIVSLTTYYTYWISIVNLPITVTIYYVYIYIYARSSVITFRYCICYDSCKCDIVIHSLSAEGGGCCGRWGIQGAGVQGPTLPGKPQENHRKTTGKLKKHRTMMDFMGFIWLIMALLLRLY